MENTQEFIDLENSFFSVMNNKVFHSSSEAWVTKISKDYQREVYVNWAEKLADWKVFLTLTFRSGKYPDVCKHYWSNLVWKLNNDLLGKHYTRIVGHSYFSYLIGIEQQSRGDYHFHVLVDKPLNFKLIHEHWGNSCGFAKTEIINSKNDAVRYITKYIVKGGQLEPYYFDGGWEPLIKPYWWKIDLLKK